MQAHSWEMKSAVALCVAAGLVACGGDDTVARDPVAQAAPLAIGASNGEAVMRQTLQAASYLLAAGGLVGGDHVAPGAKPLFTVNRGRLARLAELLRSAGPRVGGATATDLLPCRGGGSVTATANDINGNGDVDAGDSGRLVATNCVESGATLNGTLDLVVGSVSGDLLGDNYSATVALRLTDLRATTAVSNVSASGTLTLMLAATGDAYRATVELETPLLVVAGQVGGVEDAITLRDWRVTSHAKPGLSGPTASVTAGGTTNSAALGGRSVTVVTGVPLVVTWGNRYPRSGGQLTASGAAGSQVWATALNAETVRIDLDVDGNGLFETSVDRAWTTVY